jgi:hypothetical protein
MFHRMSLGRNVHVSQSQTVILPVFESDDEQTRCNRLAISSAYKSVGRRKVVPVLKCGGVEVQLTLPIVEIMPFACK